MTKKKNIKPNIQFTEKTRNAIFNELDNIVAKGTSQFEHGKTISISELPNCLHKARLVNITENPDKAKVCIVAVRNNDKQSWQAYAGYPEVNDLTQKAREVGQPFLMPLDFVWLCENVHDAEQVRFMGEVLPKEVATQLFPDWKQDQYRVE